MVEWLGHYIQVLRFNFKGFMVFELNYCAFGSVAKIVNRLVHGNSFCSLFLTSSIILSSLAYSSP